MQHNDFVLKIKKLFPEITIISIFNGFKENILIQDKFGICSVNPNNLQRGHIPTIKTAINKTEYFKNLIKYINPNMNYEIVSEFISMKDNITYKDKYGLLTSSALTLYKGNKSSIRSAVNPTEYFINQAKEKFEKKFDYSLVEYKDSHKNVKIICKKHNQIFEATPSNHLNKSKIHGCPICGKESSLKFQQENAIGWKHSKWKLAGLKSKNFITFQLYVIYCWDKNEEFYKIGKTFTNIKNRFPNKTTMPYNYKIIKLIEGEAKFISELEVKYKKILKNFKYIPLINFKGKFECFKIK